MSISHWSLVTVAAVAMTGGLALQAAISPEPAAQAQAANTRVFELRTYTAAPGKMENLKARFRDHVLPLFAKHGLQAIGGYYIPQDPPLSENTIIYVLVHESREAADRNWKAFQSDPEWIKARDASVAEGPITTSVTRMWLDPADFSPVK